MFNTPASICLRVSNDGFIGVLAAFAELLMSLAVANAIAAVPRNRRRFMIETSPHKCADELRDLIGSGIDCKVSCVEHVDFCRRHVAPVSLRFGKLEREIVFAPDDEQARLRLAHPRLPLGIRVEVRSIVVKEIALNVRLSGLIEKVELVGPEIGIVAFDVWVAADMPRARR